VRLLEEALTKLPEPAGPAQRSLIRDCEDLVERLRARLDGSGGTGPPTIS